MLCDNCFWAEWKRTETGRLHPNKAGKCTKLEKRPLNLDLPAAFYWIGGTPRPTGGLIERGVHLRTNCSHYIAADSRRNI